MTAVAAPLAGARWDEPATGRVVAGPGTLARLAELVAGARRVLVVSDPGVRAAGIVDRVEALLAGLVVTTYDQVPPNPSTAALDLAAALARASDAELVVAVGGGSALDAAKAVALMATRGGAAEELALGAGGPPGLPIVAVPTTAGTGAETNGFGVCEDAAHRKVYLGDASTVPAAVVLDPELTLGLPPSATAATGFDAVVHGVESLLSRGATPVSRAFARESLRLTTASLRAAVADGTDLEARTRMMLGANLAGRALTLSGLGLVHGLGHSLTALTGVPHGVALAAVAGPALRVGVEADPVAGADVAATLGVPTASDAVELVVALAADVGLPAGVADLDEELVALLVERTLADPVSRNAPRVPDAAGLTRLVRRLGRGRSGRTGPTTVPSP